MNLRPRLSADGKLNTTDRGWLLSISAGSAGRYRLSQLDDHLGLPRAQYPCRPPLTLRLEARASSAALPGTWGFGLWNDPYGFSFGPGNSFLRLPALPNSAWFFFSSRISYLSFRDDRPANGFLAQVFASPRFSLRLAGAALMLPFSPKAARRQLSQVIREDARRLDGNTQPRSAAAKRDVTEWHRYAVEWTDARTRFHVDDVCVLDAPLSPRPPLGIVLWIDNQHAGFNPQGKLTYGLEPNPEPAWLEIRDLRIS